MLTEIERKRAINVIIITQCLGMVILALFQNGFYLNYFTKLGISSAAIAMLFALPPLLGTFALLPFAFYSDRFGKKRLALIGQLLLIVSLLILMGAGWSIAGLALPLVVASLVLFSIGFSLQVANWFALLNPIIPEEIRGRFFGRLRVSFQTVSILFTLLATRVLEGSPSMTAFQILLSIVFAASLLRYYTYARIPELENAAGETGNRQTFRSAFSALLRVTGYMQFNGYVFLITLFTAAVPIVFGLMQKDVFVFSPAQISLMGMFFLVGGIIGCWVGGPLVDRFGTRFVFLGAHMAYAAVMLAMLTRHWVPWSLAAHAGGCSLLFSLIIGMAGVGVSSEMLALIPETNKALSTACTLTLINGATAVSGMLVARAISWEILSSEWQMLGRTYSAYDTLLLAFAVLTLLMLGAIRLVPKIVRQVQLMPGSYPRI
ncbi:MAG: MFS transporter [Pontiella sp.]|nr:MFS transporter [Pontiella sp.]